MEWTSWLQLIQKYGPIVGLFVGFVVWQAHQINKLLDRNSAIYEGEIKRLAEVQARLLDRLLGPQPSSVASPTMEDLRTGVQQVLGQGKAEEKR